MKKLLLVAFVVIFGSPQFNLKAQSPGALDSSYAENGMSTFWLEIDEIVHGLQVNDIHLLPSSELLAVGTTKWGCSGTWTTKGILFKIDNNGFLDTTYFEQGYHIFDTEGFIRILPLPEQKYLLASSQHLLKINQDGSIDTDFGNNGYLNPEVDDVITAELDNDGNIVIGGRIYNYSPTDSDYDYLLKRFDQNGNQDMDFGDNGLCYPVDTLGSQGLSDIAIDSEGRITVTGNNYIDQNEFHMLVSRVLPNGTRDTTFGDNGAFIEDYTNRSRGMEVFIDSEDNIFVTGNAKMSTFGYWGVLLTKINANGSSDADFGENGFRFKEVPGDGYPDRIHQLSDSSLVITGRAYSEFLYMAKFDHNGSPVSSFGEDGVVTIEAFEYTGYSTDSELDNNKIIISGNSRLGDCAQTKYKAVFMRFAVDDAEISVSANQPDDLNVCSSATTDTSASVNLESIVPQIIGEQTSVEVHFYNSLEDAENDVSAIENPNAQVVNSSSQEFFARAESTADSTLFEVTSFHVYLSFPSPIDAPTPFQKCDDDLDGLVEFNLSTKSDEILGDLENATLSYFSSENAAHADETSTEIDSLYINQTPNADTVWVRVDEESGCSSVISLPLIVNPIPQFTLDSSEIALCDISNDTLETLDLFSETDELFDNLDTSAFNISFFQNIEDAEANVGSVNSPADFEIDSLSQNLFIGIENQSTGCYSIVEEPVTISLNPLPVDSSQVSDYPLCDADFNGSEEFDLTSRIPEVLGNQDSSIYEVYFFMNQENAEENADPIDNPEEYLSETTGQTIFAGIFNSETGCYIGVNQSFELSVLPQPEIVQQPDTLILPDGNDDNEAIFDLTLNETLILGDQDSSSIHISYHESMDDASNGMNEIENPDEYTNISNPQTIYVAVYNADSLCVSFTQFELLVDDEISVENELVREKMKVYPNPAIDFLWVDGGDLTISQVSISDLQGRKVYSSHETSKKNRVRVDVSKLTPGTYTVLVKSGKSILREKIIIR